MKSKIRFKSIAGTALFITILGLVLSACSSLFREDQTACHINLDMRVTIDGTDIEPQVAFDQLAREPDCAISISPFIRKHITLHAENVTVGEVLAAVCQQAKCKYVFDGQHLSVSHLSLFDMLKLPTRWNQHLALAEWQRRFEERLPENMYFEDASVKSVLEEISKVFGLEITPWEGEGDQKVTLDIGGMTVDEALEAVVRLIDDCEGAVLVESWNGGIAQHVLVDKP